MIWSVGAKVYLGTSVLWSACEVAIEVQMVVVVVVETWKVVVEKCSEKASGSVARSKVIAWMETAAVYVACQGVPM